KIESKLQTLPLVRKLSADPAYTAYRAWQGVDSNVLESSMVGGTLSVPGGFAVKPVIFINEKTCESVTVVHVGRRLCGYPFLVHGGILATILDEAFKKTAAVLRFDGDKAKVKTDKLTLSYKFPTLADQFIVVKANLAGDETGELTIKGVVENIRGRPLVKGELEFKSPALVAKISKKWYF
ncbi:hypothetical protein BABINDRAFT_18440, partial [Babjeviella inositovora NRRL Y-12698]